MNVLSLPDEWSAEDLYARYTHAPAVAIGRRYHALYLRRLGHPPKEIAALLGITREAIRKWIVLARTDALDRLGPPAGGKGDHLMVPAATFAGGERDGAGLAMDPGAAHAGGLFTTDAQLDGVLCDALNGLASDSGRIKSLTNQRWLYANTSS